VAYFRQNRTTATFGVARWYGWSRGTGLRDGDTSAPVRSFGDSGSRV
jgi:hypothetical protein